ncbi:hypothetical protein X797_007494 [Metarhizium robertsii]|uniref:Retrotransposon gag domain-containing protein n=1 Tax=Metarhizium robertsii TaxID=568076 RepID=A0A014PPA5_9HYPO|nr:hypothetical protein X797_007494 [Metarhizium robertsii]
MENNSQDGGSPSRTTQMPVQMMNQMSEQLNAIHRDQQHIRNERDNDREETRAQVQALESAIATPNHTSSEDIVNSVLQRLGLVPLVLNTTSPANIHSPQQGQLPAKKKPTLPNPQRLDRTRKLFCPWLLQMRSKLHVDGPALGGSFDQFVYIYSQLDKTPQAIAAAYLEKGGLDGLSNPVDFLKYMSTCYADPNIEQRALSRLETIRQGPQENFAIFLPKFEKELADSGGASWDNAVKINFLKRVISGELRSHLAGQLSLLTKRSNPSELISTNFDSIIVAENSQVVKLRARTRFQRLRTHSRHLQERKRPQTRWIGTTKIGKAGSKHNPGKTKNKTGFSCYRCG